MLTKPEFDALAQIIKQFCAVDLDQAQSLFIEQRLLPLAKEEGFVSVGELIKKLSESPPPGLKKRVVEVLTTQEVAFFRELGWFQLLKERVMPELAVKRASTKELRFWSATAGPGQEPISFAILLKENGPKFPGWRMRMIATESSERMIDRAKAGIYSQLEVNRGLPVTLLLKYFTKQGMDWAIKDDLAQIIEYYKFDLLTSPPAVGPVDVVFLRSSLANLSQEAKTAAYENIHKLMAPDGYLFLVNGTGHEGIANVFERVPSDKAVCFQPRVLSGVS